MPQWYKFAESEEELTRPGLCGINTVKVLSSAIASQIRENIFIVNQTKPRLPPISDTIQSIDSIMMCALIDTGIKWKA